MKAVFMKKLFLLLIILSVFPLFSQETVYPFNLKLTEENFDRLLSGSAIRGRMDESAIPLLIPEHELTESLYDRFPTEVYGDTVFLRVRDDNMDNEEYLLDQLNRCIRFSEQKGIQYRSMTQGWLTLINNSYTIETGERKKKIDDHQFSSLPQSTVIYAFQKDYYFSSNRFKYEIITAENGIKVTVTNLTDMRVKGIFRAMDREKMTMEFYFITDGDYICVYGVSIIEGIQNPIEVLGKRIDLPSAMSRRMNSLINWFLE